MHHALVAWLHLLGSVDFLTYFYEKIFVPLFIMMNQRYTKNCRDLLARYQCTESGIFFMYLRAIFCTFQISVDFYYVPVGGRGGGRGGTGEGEGARIYTVWVHLVC
jgi:hypothetical protein